jgi:zinc ribbon protein/Sel1 repeat-containing protein
VRCGRCGNENDESNRFCGMCGASLVATTQAAGQSPGAAPTGSVATPRQAAVPVPAAPMQSAPRQAAQAPVSEPARLSSATAERRPAPLPSSNTRSSPGPVITGHSFLGLSSPGPAVERHSEHDSLRPSSNLDYLLEDEEPKRGWGKLGFIVIALALAVGLGYLHFKQTGFGGLTAGDKKPTAAKPASDVAPGADSGGAAGPATPDSTAPAAGISAGTTPATGGAATSPAGSDAGAATPSTASQMPAQTTPNTTPSPVTPPQTIPSQAQPSDPNLPAAVSPPASSGADKQTSPAEPAPEPKAAVRKPSAAAKPVDPVTYAERYIYGRGVRQDCDHGLRLLKPAAEQSNAKAMITLGALYSTGTCAPRDLPTAYRWFALALHQEPDNQALQNDLQKLWSQMTQPERQLAIKLSQ